MEYLSSRAEANRDYFYDLQRELYPCREIQSAVFPCNEDGDCFSLLKLNARGHPIRSLYTNATSREPITESHSWFFSKLYIELSYTIHFPCVLTHPILCRF